MTEGGEVNWISMSYAVDRRGLTSMLLLIRLVTNSVSAAVPAPQHLM